MARSRFPLGHMTKPEVRQLAYDWGHEELSKKAESFEICFVPDNDYRGFLKRRLPDLEAKVAGGDFVSVDGKKMGKHAGYPFYTIGQRKGLGIAFGEPMYVTKIDAVTNQVTLGRVGDLVRNGMMVGGATLQKYTELPAEGMEFTTKVRYKDAGTLSLVEQISPDRFAVDFFADVRGVAPGQSAVFYEGDDVVGGGLIHASR